MYAVQHPSTLRLGASNGSTTIRLANLGSAGPLLLSYGQEAVLFTNSTHTILYSVAGSSSVSLSSDASGSSVINVVGDIINLSGSQVGITGNLTVTNTATGSTRPAPPAYSTHEAFLADLSDATLIATYYYNHSDEGNFTQVHSY